MAISMKTENYFDEAYWNHRYTRDAGSFDWYQHYKGIADIIKMYAKLKDEVLMVGCGSAHVLRLTVFVTAKLLNKASPKSNGWLQVLSEEMVKDGYEKIMNIDISEVLIEVMTRKYKHMPQLRYKRMDVRCMSEFKDKSFACVLDKGMLDNLMCGAGAQASAAAMLSEVLRVLKPGGKYILVTYRSDPITCAPRPHYTLRWLMNRIYHIVLLAQRSWSLLISYGDPRGRLPYLRTRQLIWDRIELHAVPRINSRRSHEAHPLRKITEPITIQRDLTLGPLFNIEDPDLHYIYICTKVGGRRPPSPPDPTPPKLICK